LSLTPVESPAPVTAQVMNAEVLMERISKSFYL